MFLLYVRERFAWIAFLFIIILFSNIFFYLDYGFSKISINYFNIVTILLVVFFLIWRYIREIKQLRNFLGNLSNTYELLFPENLSLSPFQKKALEKMMDIIEEKDSLINETNLNFQEGQEDLLAYVHEMKTPLTAMKLMIDQTDNSNMRKKLEREWIRMHLLLDQQLHNTRLASIEKDNRLEKVELRSIVYKEIREFQSWCIEKGIGFQVEELNEEVITDRKWLAFIVRQLLSNAIKYSHPESEISIYTTTDSNGHVLLHFRDFGVGIHQEDLPRIFQKSYTGTIGRESVQSTGMGLYLAQNAAQKLGITITVNTIFNEGSTFTLQFPHENLYEKTFGR